MKRGEVVGIDWMAEVGRRISGSGRLDVPLRGPEAANHRGEVVGVSVTKAC